MRILAFLALLALALVLEAPAWLVAERAGTATGGRLAIVNPAGTAWNGSGDAVIATGNAAPPAALGRVRWHLARVGADGMTFALEQAPAPPADASASRASITLGADAGSAAGALQMPASTLSALVPLAADWRFAGTCTIESDRLAWSPRGVEGRARVRWRSASLAPPGPGAALALGDIDVMVEAGADGVGATWTNDGGAVAVAGGIDRATRNLRLQLQPRAGTTAPDLAWLPARLGPPPPTGYALGFTVPPLFGR